MANLENNNKQLFNELSQIIEQGKQALAIQVNSTLTLTFWYVGKRINEEVLKNKRAEYGKQIVSTVSTQLTEAYGKSFHLRNVRRMIQFAEQFTDEQIVVSLSRQLSWSHFIELFSLKSQEAKQFYAQKIAEESWGIRHTRKQIKQKAFERQEIANTQLSNKQSDLQHTFKDPYFLDFLGLKEGYFENDLESAILKELEQFILELGKGFTFVERQKRIILDGKDFYLDLLFYHRKLKRLVAIELKIGHFEPSHKGQIELYLKWLKRYEKMEGENDPIGLILCTEASSEQIELLEMHKDGIMVAEYWTELPPKEQLEQKIHEALISARERLERKKLQ